MSLPLVLPAPMLQEQLNTLKSQQKTLADAGIVLVDLRSAEVYAQGHIEGAVHGDAILLNRSAPPAGGLLPEPDAVNQFLGQIGARMGDRIIAYDGGLQTTAARLIWVLDAYGYETGIWLNGGMRAWQHHNLPLSTTIEKPRPGTLTLEPIGDNVISTDTLMGLLNHPDMRILDVRSRDEYAGKDIRATYGGHVPGAIHQEWSTMLDAYGQLLPDEQLRQQLDTLGIEDGHTVIVYCQTHQRSSMTYVILKHLGLTDVRAIDGAWSAWGSRSDTPKETPLTAV